jgi:hypothetical protein
MMLRPASPVPVFGLARKRPKFVKFDYKMWAPFHDQELP